MITLVNNDGNAFFEVESEGMAKELEAHGCKRVEDSPKKQGRKASVKNDISE